MPVIPPPLFKKILAFCLAGHTGQILLHVHQGQICSYALTETGTVVALAGQETAQHAPDWKETLTKRPMHVNT